MIIYLDESGDLGFDFENKQPSRYFVITVLVRVKVCRQLICFAGVYIESMNIKILNGIKLLNQ